MKKISIIFLFLIVIIAGCAKPKKVFYPNQLQTQEQFEVDKGSCNYKAKQAALEEDFSYNKRVEIWRGVFEECMADRGYELETSGRRISYEK